VSTSSLLHLPVTCTAVLRDISIGTSYQIVRLVFRPYTHLMPSSWTSERLRSSIGVSPDFNHNRYSSLSFGSYHCNYSISLGYWLLSFTSLQWKSPWSVFQYGCDLSPYSPVFSLFHSLNETFSSFLRSTSSLSVSPLYLALDVVTTLIHTALPSNATLYSVLLYLRLSLTLASLSIEFHYFQTYNSNWITIRALSSSVAPTTEIHVCFFSYPDWYA